MNRSGLAVVAIVKNEESLAHEWAMFHLVAGVKHFFIYDDCCTDETIPILRQSVPPEMLTVIPWGQRLSDQRLGREIHNQVLAYAHAASNFGSDFRWMAFIDFDEFLVPVNSQNLDDALAPLNHVANLSLPWHMFGTSGHAHAPAGGVVANYLWRAADPMSKSPGLCAFKCIVDPCRLTAVRIHSMETDHSEVTYNDQGLKADLGSRMNPPFYSADRIQLNHYYTRSQSELEAKISRGPNLKSKADQYRRKVLRTVASIEQSVVEDRRALDYWLCQSKRV
jgi:hypothetical protein